MISFAFQYKYRIWCWGTECGRPSDWGDVFLSTRIRLCFFEVKADAKLQQKLLKNGVFIYECDIGGKLIPVSRADWLEFLASTIFKSYPLHVIWVLIAAFTSAPCGILRVISWICFAPWESFVRRRWREGRVTSRLWNCDLFQVTLTIFSSVTY